MAFLVYPLAFMTTLAVGAAAQIRTWRAGDRKAFNWLAGGTGRSCCEPAACGQRARGSSCMIPIMLPVSASWADQP
jgi:hypothetical protein